MSASKVAIAAIVPATIVAGRFFVPALSEGGLAWFFTVTGFLATLVGCLAAAVVMRRRLARIPAAVVGGIAVAAAGLLLVIFPTMPNWPFTGEGFVVAWVLMAAAFTGVFTYAISYRYA